MKQLLAKILVSLACAIILLHAFVPHHHHDCEGQQGLIYECEVACHCDCSHHDFPHGQNHHSHHPYSTCKLAEMLSHLVLSTKDDNNHLQWVPASPYGGNNVVYALSLFIIPVTVTPQQPIPVPVVPLVYEREMFFGQPPFLASSALRAPPSDAPACC